MATLCRIAVLLSLALVLVWAQDGGYDEGGDGGYGGFEGGDGGGGGFGGGYGGGDDGGFVGGGGEGGYGDGYDGTALRPVYASPDTIMGPTVVLRRRRSAPAGMAVESSQPHRRVRRGGYGVVGPVHTYVRTDYDGNFKWGARHHVGKSYGGHYGGRGGSGYGHY
ncbi:uncharacterized protein LOC144151781 [Haemaphysalis longicornis]